MANTGAWAFAVTQSFILNRFWTFHATRHDSLEIHHYGKQFLMFIVVSIGCLAISNGTVWMLVDYYPAMVAKLIATVLVLIWGFFLSKRLVFGAHKPETTQEIGQHADTN